MFDSILAQYNHFGTVMVEFEVNAQGLIVEKKVRIAAEDPILKVHVMRAIRRGLNETFRKEKWNPLRINTTLQARFDFLQGSGEIPEITKKADLLSQDPLLSSKINVKFISST